VAKKRKTSSKSKRKKKAARPRRKSVQSAPKGIDFNPVKKQLKAHIEKLEKEAGAFPDAKAQDTLTKLKTLQNAMTDLCIPTMIIPPP
jgi:hypothetical protein